MAGPNRIVTMNRLKLRSEKKSNSGPNLDIEGG